MDHNQQSSCPPWRQCLQMPASHSHASSSETENLPRKHLHPLSTHCTPVNNIPWLNWMDKNRRGNKQSLGEALADAYTVKSKKLCGKLHGVTLRQHKEKKSWLCGRTSRKDGVVKSLEERHQEGLASEIVVFCWRYSCSSWNTNTASAQLWAIWATIFRPNP